jgi:hypothetical protein
MRLRRLDACVPENVLNHFRRNAERIEIGCQSSAKAMPLSHASSVRRRRAAAGCQSGAVFNPVYRNFSALISLINNGIALSRFLL